METIARTFRYLAVLAVTACIIVTAQDFATVPIDGAEEICRDSPEPIWIADKENNCWYWRCNRFRGRSFIIPTARRCAVGSKVSDFFDYGPQNPCQYLFLETERFDCTRKTIIDGMPPPPSLEERKRIEQPRLTALFVSRQTAMRVVEEEEEEEEERDSDEESTRPPVTTLDPRFLPCNRQLNHCRIEARRMNLTTTNNPCRNNAQCMNTCYTFQCSCTNPNTAGRLCEQFSCEDNVECLNGGTCVRGPEGTSPTFTCICGSGFTGQMCEVHYFGHCLGTAAGYRSSRILQWPKCRHPVSRSSVVQVC